MGLQRKYNLTDRCTVTVETPDAPPDARVVGIDGDLDAETYDAFGAVVERLLDGGVKHLVLDFGDLGYISSSGVGILMVIHRRLEEMGGRMAITSPTSSVREILDLLHFSDFVTYHDTPQRALAVLGGAV